MGENLNCVPSARVCLGKAGEKAGLGKAVLSPLFFLLRPLFSAAGQSSGPELCCWWCWLFYPTFSASRRCSAGKKQPLFLQRQHSTLCCCSTKAQRAARRGGGHRSYCTQQHCRLSGTEHPRRDCTELQRSAALLPAPTPAGPGLRQLYNIPGQKNNSQSSQKSSQLLSAPIWPYMEA